MNNSKHRLDKLLVLKGLVENSNKAKYMIMDGRVFVNGQKIMKSGHKFYYTDTLSVKLDKHPWVSRGGIKLDGAIRHFNLRVKGMICADVGCSTGGFTDVLLSLNAKKIFAIDVGMGQFAWKLRKNPKVILMEKTNARYLDHSYFNSLLDIIVCDVSFISLVKALDKILELTSFDASLLALIKPQFELHREKVGKNGVVTNNFYREEAVNKVIKWLEIEKNWRIVDIFESPIKGAKGNIEYFIYARHS